MGYYIYIAYLSWLREPDLNRRPSGYEPDELPGCSIPRPYLNTEQSVLSGVLHIHRLLKLVAGAGFEPTTFGL